MRYGFVPNWQVALNIVTRLISKHYVTKAANLKQSRVKATLRTEQISMAAGCWVGRNNYVRQRFINCNNLAKWLHLWTVNRKVQRRGRSKLVNATWTRSGKPDKISGQVNWLLDSHRKTWVANFQHMRVTAKKLTAVNSLKTGVNLNKYSLNSSLYFAGQLIAWFTQEDMRGEFPTYERDSKKINSS